MTTTPFSTLQESHSKKTNCSSTISVCTLFNMRVFVALTAEKRLMDVVTGRVNTPTEGAKSIVLLSTLQEG